MRRNSGWSKDVREFVNPGALRKCRDEAGAGKRKNGTGKDALEVKNPRPWRLEELVGKAGKKDKTSSKELDLGTSAARQAKSHRLREKYEERDREQAKGPSSYDCAAVANWREDNLLGSEGGRGGRIWAKFLWRELKKGGGARKKSNKATGRVLMLIRKTGAAGAGRGAPNEKIERRKKKTMTWEMGKINREKTSCHEIISGRKDKRDSRRKGKFGD